MNQTIHVAKYSTNYNPIKIRKSLNQRTSISRFGHIFSLCHRDIRARYHFFLQCEEHEIIVAHKPRSIAGGTFRYTLGVCA